MDIEKNKLLVLGKFYGFFLWECLVNNQVMSLEEINFYNFGLTQEQIELGLEYLTLTNFLSAQVNNARTQ